MELNSGMQTFLKEEVLNLISSCVGHLSTLLVGLHCKRFSGADLYSVGHSLTQTPDSKILLASLEEKSVIIRYL